MTQHPGYEISRVIIKNGSLFGIVASHALIDFLVSALQSGAYSHENDTIEVITTDEWSRRNTRKISR